MRKAGDKKLTKAYVVLPCHVKAYQLNTYFRKARFYHNLYENLVESVTLFWDNATGAWYDYDLETKTLQKRFYPTNIFPLLLKRSSEEVCERVLDYLNATGVLKYQGRLREIRVLRTVRAIATKG